jgi:hypothetical protein
MISCLVVRFDTQLDLIESVNNRVALKSFRCVILRTLIQKLLEHKLRDQCFRFRRRETTFSHKCFDIGRFLRVLAMRSSQFVVYGPT